MKFVSEENREKLSDSGKKQICVQGFMILSSSGSNGKRIFKVIDRAFDSGTDFVGVVPVVSTANSTGESAKVFFRVDVNHSAASGGSTRIIAVSDTSEFAVRTFSVLHLGADELECRHPAAEIRSAALRFHWKLGVVRTARDTMFIDGIAGVFQAGAMIQGNICFRKVPVLAESIAGKQAFVDLDGIKSSVAEKGFGVEKRVCLEEIL